MTILVPSFLNESSTFLQVTSETIIAWMSLNLLIKFFPCQWNRLHNNNMPLPLRKVRTNSKIRNRIAWRRFSR